MKKRLFRLLAAVLCLCLLPIGSLAASSGSLRVSFTVTTYQSRARDLLRQLNAYRRQNGLPVVEMSADLENAAIQRAAELFVFFDHDRPDLTEYDTVLEGYAALKTGEAVAECIAAGYSKAAETMDDWAGSAAELLKDGDFTHAGIACVYVKGSYNEYYWAMILQRQPAAFKGKAAASNAKAGKAKTVSVEISSKMYARADESHKRFELRANDLTIKTATTARPTVYLYDRYDVKIGKCDLSTLSFKSSNTSVFTVTVDGSVKRKKAGSGTLTISAPGLTAISCAVATGSTSSAGSTSSTGSAGSAGNANSTAVTAATIGDRRPELDVKAYKDHSNLSVYVRGASGYVLYRSATRSGTYSKAAEKASTSRWTYRLEGQTKAYYYKVHAYKNSGGKRVYSEYSAPVRVEACILLSHKKPDGTIGVKVEFGKGVGNVPLDNIANRAEAYKPKKRMTYKMIKESIEAKYGFRVLTTYIA